VRLQDFDPSVAASLAGQMPRYVPGRQARRTADGQHDVRVVLAYAAPASQSFRRGRVDTSDPPLVVERPVDPGANGTQVCAADSRCDFGDDLIGFGQAGGSEIPPIEVRLARSRPVGAGLDVEHELNLIIDLRHEDIDGHVPEAVEEGPHARRLHSLDAQLPASSLLRPVSRWRDDSEPLVQIGDGFAVTVTNPLVEHERAQPPVVTGQGR